MLLTIIIISLFPVLLQLQYERVSIREEREAISILQSVLLNQYQDFSVSLPVEVQGKSPTYDLQISQLNAYQVQYCLLWEGRNGREQTWCLSSYDP
ncbi:hypothetical protein ACM26V_00560 [Salipaludibacillus sp. HK11]|uniref:hypothetical protein n=1 Tax=Salipaludibacillus sp. HK11 TaxID=3394320 RepID=UPI0039FBA5A2